MWWILGIVLILVAVTLYDITQRKHAIIRNFPIVGHFRYWLENIGPELRQYIVTNNDEERPFSRDQRRWVYASSKKQNNYFGFGTDNDLERSGNYLILKHSAFPIDDPHAGAPGFDPQYTIPCAKTLGAARGRAKAFRPDSVINVSAMSFGSLSAQAIEALNRGAKICGCMHNSGEGGVSGHHRHGGDLVWQLGTGYFGCRDENGAFSMEKFAEVVGSANIKAIEIKLSQGAKPGLGGVLPAVKITHELAEIRGIPMGRDCVSPSAHKEFSNADSMLDFVESLAEKSSLPVGIKSAVGEMGFWEDLASKMGDGSRGVDFITIDGGEGGTGAAPLAFSDHVALPFMMGFSRVYSAFARAGLTDNVVFIGSGRLGFPERSLAAMALGCDMVNVAREAMLAIGCIQAQRCHTNHCPAGVATQNKWLVRGLDPDLKSARLANYVMTLRKEMLRITRACGEEHPALLNGDHIEILDERFGGASIQEVFKYEFGWGLPCADDCAAVSGLMRGKREAAGSN